MRTSKDAYKLTSGLMKGVIVMVGGDEEPSPKSTNAILWNGYDYKNQAWVKNGKYVKCNHPESMQCNCFGTIHEGEKVLA